MRIGDPHGLQLGLHPRPLRQTSDQTQSGEARGRGIKVSDRTEHMTSVLREERDRWQGSKACTSPLHPFQEEARARQTSWSCPSTVSAVRLVQIKDRSGRAADMTAGRVRAVEAAASMEGRAVSLTALGREGLDKMSRFFEQTKEEAGAQDKDARSGGPGAKAGAPPMK